VRYFFHIGYQGQAYSGWQKLPGIISIQEVLETTLSRVLKAPITINGCGRTDAQVHASQFFFHADLTVPEDVDLLFRLNKGLPSDIAIFDILPVAGTPHARLDAVQRSYDYFIHTYKDPFLHSGSALYLGKMLDLPSMKRAAALLTQYNDYRAFCVSPDKYRTTICTVSRAQLFTNEAGDRVRFHISANRFLGKMIRIIMHRLLQVGDGSMSLHEFEQYLIDRVPPKTIRPAYPQGLYLSRVVYPFLDLPRRTEFSTVFGPSESYWREVLL
jgi:tRNA pseudouridine38-40 synthase